jgi:hypothetical protein
MVVPKKGGKVHVIYNNFPIWMTPYFLLSYSHARLRNPKIPKALYDFFFASYSLHLMAASKMRLVSDPELKAH